MTDIWNKGRFWKTPVGILVIILSMVAVILGMTVFSTREETRVLEKRESESDPKARPEAIPDKVITPASEEEVIISEDGNLPTKEKSQGSYRNDRRLSVQTGYGMTFFLGLDQAGLNDALYLNPHFEYDYARNPNEAYGYLMRTERVPLEYSESIAAPAWSTEYNGMTDFIIQGRTFDKVVPARAKDSDHYGVRWTDSPAYGGLENSGDKLHILIVRISDGTLMGTATADISWNAKIKTYGLENLVNGDVAQTKELTDQKRYELFQQAIQYLLSGNEKMTLSVTEEELQSQFISAVVEHTPRTYYNRLYDSEGNVVSSGKFSNCDIYAVNLNCDGYGFFTVYFAPEPQAHGLSVRKLDEDDNLKLVVIGYDAFAPFTEETFNSFLFPEDAERFGTKTF